MSIAVDEVPANERNRTAQLMRVSQKRRGERILKRKRVEAQADSSAEALRDKALILALMLPKRRALWELRFLLPPDPGDPGAWAGRVSRAMRKDWVYCRKLLERQRARDGMVRIGRWSRPEPVPLTSGMPTALIRRPIKPTDPGLGWWRLRVFMGEITPG